MPRFIALVVALVMAAAAAAGAQVPSKTPSNAGDSSDMGNRGVAVASKLFVPRGIGRYLSKAVVRADGAIAATIDDAGLVALWDVKRGRAFDTVPLNGEEVALAPDKSLLIVLRAEQGGKEIVVYDYQKHQIAERIPSASVKVIGAKNEQFFPTSILFDEKGRLYASSNGRIFGIIDLTKRSLLPFYNVGFDSKENYWHLTPSPDAKYAVGVTELSARDAPFKGLVLLDLTSKKIIPRPQVCAGRETDCNVRLLGFVDGDRAVLFGVNAEERSAIGRIDLTTGSVAWTTPATSQSFLWIRKGSESRFFALDLDENAVELDLLTGRAKPVDDERLRSMMTRDMKMAFSGEGAVAYEEDSGHMLSIRCKATCKSLDIREMAGLSATISNAWRVGVTDTVALESRDSFFLLDVTTGKIQVTEAPTPRFNHRAFPVADGREIFMLSVLSKSRKLQPQIFNIDRQIWIKGDVIDQDPYGTETSGVAVGEYDADYFIVGSVNIEKRTFSTSVYKYDRRGGRITNTDVFADSCPPGAAQYEPRLRKIILSCYTSDPQLIDPVSGKIEGAMGLKSDGLVYRMVVNDGATRALVDSGNAYTNGGIRPVDLRKKVVAKSIKGTVSGNVLIRVPGDRAISGSSTGAITELDVNTGQVLRNFAPHTTNITAIVPLVDRGRIVTTSIDGMVNISEFSSGKLLATLVVDNEGRRIIYTPELFFDAPNEIAGQVGFQGKGTELVLLSRDIRSLYRPDLVRERLAGDPTGKVREAARRTSNKRILDESLLPSVTLAAPADGTELGASVEAVAEVVDPIGDGARVEWRINGFVVGIDTVAAAGKAQTVRLVRELALQTGANAIEVAASTVDVDATYGEPVLARVIGQAGEEERGRLFLLGLAVGQGAAQEASAIELRSSQAALATHSATLFRSVEQRLLEGTFSAQAIGEQLRQLSSEMRANDSLVLHVSGNGRLDGNALALALAEDAVMSGDELERHIASLPPRRVLLIYDLTESGLDGVDTRGNDVRAVMAAERLTRATGRSAFVMLRRAGGAASLVTDALVTGVARGDMNGDGEVDITELLSSADKSIREASTKAGATMAPYLRVIGSDWPIALAASPSPRPEPRDPMPTHVAIAEIVVRDQPVESAKELGRVEAGTSARVVTSEDGWALIARDGVDLGFVPAAQLVPLQ